MKKNLIIKGTVLLLLSIGLTAKSYAIPKIMGWKIGVAKTLITPKENMWMAGNETRIHGSMGKSQDLWVKVLAIQDSLKKTALLITLDIYGINKEMSDRVRDQLKLKYNLQRSQIIINCSNTYSGPVIKNFLYNLFTLPSEEIEKIESYTSWLERQIEETAGKALQTLEEADIFAQNGFSRVGVNRRFNNEKDLTILTEIKGPSDFSVPVLKITNKNGEVKAIVFGYACHNSVLNDYTWSGDFAGYAQAELEKKYPGTTALFFQGCGADQEPLPRQNGAFVQQYGETLSFAVEAILSQDMPKLKGKLSTAYSELQLPLSRSIPPSKEELQKIFKDEDATDYEKRCAENLIRDIQAGRKIKTAYTYPVQIWLLGNQPIIALGGEVVVDYSIKLKRILGEGAFVMGYSNDVMSYIPTAEIIWESANRGYNNENYFYQHNDFKLTSYEGGIVSQMQYGLPFTWSATIENSIVSEVVKLAKQIRVPVQE